jgi:hypothetical protein
MNGPHVVHLPGDAAKSIASALRQQARKLLYSPEPSQRDIRHASRLRVFADMIDPREDDHGAK